MFILTIIELLIVLLSIPIIVSCITLFIRFIFKKFNTTYQQKRLLKTAKNIINNCKFKKFLLHLYYELEHNKKR